MDAEPYVTLNQYAQAGEPDRFARMDSISQFIAPILTIGDNNRIFLGQ